MRNFETARLLRVNLCQLNAMTDAELEAEIKLNQPKPFKQGVSVPATTNASIDINATWRTSSAMTRGATPYIRCGAISHKRAKVL